MRGNRRSLQFDNSCLLRSQVDGGGVILIKKRPQSYSSYAAVYDEFEEDLIETDFKNTSLTYCTLAASTKKTPNKNKSLESASLLGPIEQTHEPPNVVVSGTTKQTSMPKESRCAVLTFTKSKELKINNCNGRDGGDQMPPNPPTTPSSAQPQQPTRRRRFDQFLKSIVGKKSSPSTTTSASSPSTSSSTAIHREPVHTAAVLNHDATSSSVALLRSPLPDIYVSDNPDAHHRSHHHLDEDDENVSLTHSMSSVQQKLWNVVPVFRREGSYSSLHNSYAPQQSRSTSFQDQPSMCGGKATTSIDLRKCETMLPLNQMHQKAHNHHRNSTSSNSNHHTSQGMRPACSMEPIKPSNRLRNSASMATCSRCSSLLSLAANGSRYSLNIANSDFVSISKLTEENAGGSPTIDEQFFACKLCLAEVSLDKSSSISQCGCSFCTECMIAYVEFEIMEGAYEISCPDALCAAQGIISLLEIEKLASTNLVEKHQRYRLNREVDIDKYRTWCPRAGCDTVCFLPSSSDRDVGGAITNQPSSSTSLSALTSAVMQNPCGLQCPTCDVEFCSNCKETWHPGSSCEDNIRRLAATGQTNSNGIQFNSDLIKCCPMCSVPIEKDEGCAQMMCKRCKHVFCWYCLASLDDDFLLRHYDKGPCKNKLGHSRASVVWHRAQVIGIFAGFGILLLVASPLLLLAAPCIVCCKCKICSGSSKMEFNESEFNDTVAGL